MTGKMKRLIYLLLGLSAGLIAFAFTGIISSAGFSSYLSLSLIQGAAIGFIFGFIFGAANIIIYKELKQGLLKAVTAALIGAVTAAAAQLIAVQGMLWSSGLLRLEWDQSMKILFPLWKGFGWMLMGMAIGAVDGIHQRSIRRSLAGLTGGLIGGLTGGLGLELLTGMMPQAPFIQSAGLILMGILIGLFLGEFERRFSFARLRVLNGEFKNREYLLIKKKTRIGEDVKEDISFHAYRDVESFQIEKNAAEVYLNSETGSQLLLNDKAYEGKQTLKYQDVIQNGSIKLLYLPL